MQCPNMNYDIPCIRFESDRIVREVQADADLRVLPAEITDQGGDMATPETRGACDMQMPRDDAFALLQCRSDLLDRSEDGDRTLGQKLPFVGEHDPTGSPVHQLHAKSRFQGAQPLRDGGRGYIQESGGSRQRGRTAYRRKKKHIVC